MPIYLVSACASGEEFVSAFRRYADRNGVVFIPIAQPLPPGRKGRFALTLKDGGVMVEGVAEVVSSAKTPSVLYGRVGMTLKFTEPDDPSKTTLGELEKARLSMKPSPLSLPPRPADVPAEPRPVPPAAGGRVDATNALAECVVIGDLSVLTSDDIPPRMGAPKFVVPSIPSVVGGRPKTPSLPPTPTPPAPTPPAPTPPPLKVPTGQQATVPRPPAPPLPPPRAATPPAALPVVAPKDTVIGMQALEKAPAAPVLPPVIAPKDTVIGMQALEKAPASVVVAATPTRDDPTMPTPASVAAAAAAAGSRDKHEVLQTVRGPAPGVDLVSPGKRDLNETMRGPAPKLPPAAAPAPRPPSTTPPPLPVVAKTPTPPTATPVVANTPTPPAANPVVANTPTPPAATPVVAKTPTPSAALPVVTPLPPELAVASMSDEDADEIDDADEATDLTELPLLPPDELAAPEGTSTVEKTGREPRKTVMGIAVVPFGVHVLPAAPARRIVSEEEARDTSVMEAQDELSGPVMITSARPSELGGFDVHGATQPAGAKLPSAVMKATVEESTPSGDWTITPGEHGPTLALRDKPPLPGATPAVELGDSEEDAPIKAIPKGPATGDWMIALDPSQPDGWSEPSKVVPRPELPPEQAGPPVSAVSSEKDLDSEAKVVPEPKPEEAKVQVDPTLIEPLQPMQPIDDFDDEPQLPPPPSASHPAMAAHELGDAPFPPTPIPSRPTPMPMPGPIPGSYITPVPGQVQHSHASGAIPMELTHGQPPRYPTGSQSSMDAPAESKRRMFVIIASAAVALLLVVLLAVVLGGEKSKAGDEAPTGSDGSGSAVVDHAITPSPTRDASAGTEPQLQAPTRPDGGSDQQAVVDSAPPDAAVTADAPVPTDAAAQVAAATECEVAVSSAPQGAEIVLGKDVLGTTPATLKLPCGVEARLTVRKQRFVSVQRAVTPKSEGQKPVRIALAKVMFTVKVSSSPPGANIFLGSKSLGITPAAIKLPAFDLSTLKIVKDGYAPDLQKITPKTNNLSISSALKKVAKKVGR